MGKELPMTYGKAFQELNTAGLRIDGLFIKI